MNSLPKWAIWWTAIFLILLGVWLCSQVKVHGQEIPPIPKFAIVPLPVNYFAVTATNLNGESDFSNEVSVSNAPNSVTLAWDKSPDTNPCVYKVWVGTASRSYTSNWFAGSNTVFTATLAIPKKRIVTVWSKNATNIRYRPLEGTWMLANKTNFSFTNPAVNALLYQGMGASKQKPATVYTSERIE